MEKVEGAKLVLIKRQNAGRKILIYIPKLMGLKDRMLENFQQIKTAKRFYWLNAFLTKSKSILTENVLNQWKIIKNNTNCGLQPQYFSDNHQDWGRGGGGPKS